MRVRSPPPAIPYDDFPFVNRIPHPIHICETDPESWSANVLHASLVVKIRIIRQPSGFLNGVSLSSYRVGHTYDMPATLATFLVIEGFAEVEMRRDDGQHVPVERRKSSSKT